MMTIKNKKQLLATKLVEDDIVNIKQNMEINDVWYLGEILEKGFCGYAKYTLKELIQEVKERGIEVDSFDVFKLGKT